MIAPITVEYPTKVRELVKSCMLQWHTVCMRSPLENRQKLVFVEGPGGDAGYEYRAKGEDKNKVPIDPKETLQVNTAQMDNLLMNAGGDVNITTLLTSLTSLQSELRPFILGFAEELQKNFNLPSDFTHRIWLNRDFWTLRLLHYLPGSIREFIAAHHVDRGDFSLHLNESLPGLEYLGEDMIWRPMEMDESSTAIIPSLQMQCISGNKIKAVEHQVKSSPTSRLFGRYSMVNFVDMISPRYNKVEFGRTQKFPEGYTYTMSDSELASWFSE